MNYLQFRTKNTVIIKYDDEWLTVTQLADKLQVSYSFLYIKLIKEKKSLKEIIYYLEKQRARRNVWRYILYEE